VLGGFTTFSGYAVDGTALLSTGRYTAAALYLGGTLAGAVLAVWLGTVAVRRVVP
jgi:CrcB protein